jgi:SAM-dependent methyltransferase
VPPRPERPFADRRIPPPVSLDADMSLWFDRKLIACQVCGGKDIAHFTTQDEHEWVRCTGCGFVFLAEMPSLAEATMMQDAETGDAYIDSYRNKFDSKMRRSRRRARELKKRMSGDRLLDVGSNIGCLVGAACEIGLDASSIEPNPSLVKFAEGTFPGRQFRCAALEEIEPGGALHDAVYCSEVIEHVVDVNRFVSALAAQLKPGGVLYLTTPHFREYVRWNRKPRTAAMAAPDHKIYFGNDNLSRLLARHGFGKIEIKPNFRRSIKLFAAKS